MRFFRAFSMTIKNKEISLKDILGTIEDFFSENGISYERLWAREYPEMSAEEVRGMFRKMPRPCNPFFLQVFYDGVDWFGDGGPRADGGEYSENSLSSSVEFFRRSDKTHYYLSFYIDVTGPEHPFEVRSADRLKTLIERKFIKKIEDEYSHCVFTLREKDELEEKNRLFEPYALGIELKLRRQLSELEKNRKKESFALALGKMSGTRPSTSVKKALLKSFPKREYRYRYDPGGYYYVGRKTANGFDLHVDIDMPPSLSSVRAAVIIRGYNFRHRFVYSEVARYRQEDIDAFIAKYRLFSDIAERELDDRLYEVYGPTPDWYFQ